MSQFLSGAGSAFSSLGSQLAAQASTPHQDLALVCALLLLWSSVGGAIGEAVAGQYWGSHMPTNLRQYLPASVSDEEVTSFYEDSKPLLVRIISPLLSRLSRFARCSFLLDPTFRLTRLSVTVVTLIKAYDFGSAVRNGATKAYESVHFLFLSPFVL
jgi:hypothetical protein